MRAPLVAVAVACLLAAFAARVDSAVRAEPGHSSDRIPQPYVTGTRSVQLDAEGYRRLKVALRQKDFAEVQRILFGWPFTASDEPGAAYDKRLATVVVQVDRDGTMGAGLVQKGEPKPHFLGVRQAWVIGVVHDPKLVGSFLMSKSSSKPHPAATTKELLRASSARRYSSTRGGTSFQESESIDSGMHLTQTIEYKDSTTIRIEQIVRKRGIGENAFARAIGLSLSGTAASVEPAGPKDEIRRTEFVNVAPEDSAAIHVSIEKIEIEENSITRVRYSFGNLRAYTTFGNHSPRGLGAGFGFALTPRRANDVGLSKPAVDGALFVAWYVKPAIEPATYVSTAGRASISLVAGVDIASIKEPKNAFLGLGVGHLLGGIGFMVGANLRSEVRPSHATSSRFYGRPTIAFVYAL